MAPNRVLGLIVRFFMIVLITAPSPPSFAAQIIRFCSIEGGNEARMNGLLNSDPSKSIVSFS